MRRYLFLVWIFLFLFSSSVRADDTSLFTSPVPPNVLIILDCSNSFDEDFYGNAVGSYAPTSKSVVGRNALISMINQFSNSIRAGLMTFQLSSDVGYWYIHNSPYFASYDPRSYCPNPPPEPGCVQYASTLDLVAGAACQTACQIGNPSFDINYFPDPIITSYLPNDPRRDHYANLVYPKTHRIVNPTDSSNYIYYKGAYPMYAPWNLGIQFSYAPDYNTNAIPVNEGSTYTYYTYSTKPGSSDGFPDSYSNPFWFSGNFGPSDSDYANGYDNFGQRIQWNYVGPTWFSDSSPGGGYLQVPVGNLTDANGHPTTTYNNLLSKLNPNENNPAGYMSCNQGDMNTCPYIINAGLTPTPGTFQTAINYYSGVNGYTSPIQAWCEKNFIVFVTDGNPDTDANGNPGTSASLMPAVLANIAALRNVTIGGTTYDIPTYVLGVGSDLQNITNLNQMAVQGGTDLNGQAYYASNPQQFLSSLQAVFSDIMQRSYSFTSPTVPTVRMVDNNILYMSAFTPNATPFWPGTLSAYQLNSNGTLPVDANGNPLNPPIWVDSIPASGSRVIKTYTSEAGFVNFNSSNLTPADLGVATAQQRDQIISYVSNQQLGDIFHSNAVIVGPPSQYFQDTGYSGPGGFYQTNQNRTKVVIVGANDGKLHAFNAATGVEMWAFIPNSVLQNLIIMQAAHTYYVDGSPTVADVWFYSSPTETTQQKVESEWRTVLVCGLRKGGNTFFALDITDTLNPTYLWQFPNSNDAATLSLVGQSWSEPAIGRVKIEGGDGNLYERWVAFVGGGYDPTGKVGNAFFVIDIKTGGIIWQFSYNSTDPQMQWMTYPLTAPPMAVDTNSDGYVDKVYIGDLGGQMWVFNVSFNALTNKSNSLWTGQRLFTAPVGLNEQHKIYYRAAVSFDTGGIPWVYFGTGDIENPTGSANPPERFYAVKDDGLGNYPRTEANLENVTNTTTFAPPQYPLEGWYILLQKSGNSLEKVLSSPSIFNHIVYFTTFTYTPSADLCSTTSASKLYAVDYLSGAGALTVDSLSQLSGTPTQSSEQIGTGAPSSPVISVNVQGQATVIIGTTNSQIFSQSAFSPQSNKSILYWRDVTR
jgi:type IV pilus assembly protein PilY1